MAINSAFFNQLKSAFVPLLKRVIALIPTKTSDLTNDSDFLTEADVTQATRQSTLSLGKTPTFLISEETTTSGGGSVTAGAGANAETTTYALKRYTAEAVRAIVGGGGGGHYVMTGQYSVDSLGNITITQVNNVDVTEFIAGDMDTIYCKIDGPLGSLLFHSASRDTQEGIYLFFCRTESAFYLLTTKLYSSVESIPADTYYIEVEIEGSTLYAAISVDKIDVAKEGEEQIFVAVSSNNGTDTITRVEHGDIQRLYSLLLNGLYWRVHAVVAFETSGSTTIANLPLFNVNPNGSAVYAASLCTSTINQTFALMIGSASSRESVPDDADYEEALEYGDGIIYVWYKLLLETYVNPEISTDISADATSDAKTVSPKAVKTWVESKGYLTQHQSLSGYATEQYVTQAIAGIANFSFQILGSGEYDANGKPTVAGASNKIYLVPLSETATNNVYAEWLYVGNDFELIGSTTVDMSGYVKATELKNVAFSGDYGDLDNTPTIPTVPTTVSSFTNDAEYRKKYIVTGGLNLSTMAITNLQHNGSACTFSDAQTAASAGKRIEMQLTYTSPFNVTQVGYGDAVIVDSSFIQISLILYANMGAGYKTYLLNAQWTSSSITATMVQLAESTDIPSLANVDAVSVNGYRIVVASAAPTSADDHTITIVV